MDKVNEYITKFGLEPYTRLPLVQKVAAKLKLPPQMVIVIFFGVLIIYCLLPIVGNFFTTVLLFLLPAYYTFKALESPDPEDDKRLLTYWIVFALVYSMDELLRSVLGFIPGYHLLRFVGMMLLYRGNFAGAKIAYEQFLRPVFARYVNEIDALIEPLEEKSRTLSEQYKKKQ